MTYEQFFAWPEFTLSTMDKSNLASQLCGDCKEKLNNEGDIVGNSLHCSVELHHEKCIKSLLDFGVDDETRDFQMYQAAKLGFLGGLNLLLKTGADVNKRDRENNFTALEAAALHGHDECVEALINEGADVNVTNEQSPMCAVVSAVKSGSQRCFELLLNAGADVNLKCNGKWFYLHKTNALLEAVERGNEFFVKLFLQAGAGVNDTIDIEYSPLALASQLGHYTIVDLLIKAGADVNYGNLLSKMSADMYGEYTHQPALIEASGCFPGTELARNITKCIELLLQAGADVNIITPLHETPLLIAVNAGFVEGLDLLIKAGSDVNRGAYDLSPLMRTSGYGYPKCLQMLLAAGANVNQTNGYGQTAISHLASLTPTFRQNQDDGCKESLHIECAKILLRAGARINHIDKDSNNVLKHYIGINREKARRNICMFLYAVGETIDDTTVQVRIPEGWPAGERTDGWFPESCENICFVPVPDYLLFKELRFDLKHLSRQAIRKHLLNLNPHEHLFGRIPKLGLPLQINKYLLFNVSLEE